MKYPWLALRDEPNCWRVGSQVYHESLLRSFRVLGEVKEMLRRGDSKETILAFIECTTGPSDGPAPEPYVCRQEAS